MRRKYRIEFIAEIQWGIKSVYTTRIIRAASRNEALMRAIDIEQSIDKPSDLLLMIDVIEL